MYNCRKITSTTVLCFLLFKQRSNMYVSESSFQRFFAEYKKEEKKVWRKEKEKEREGRRKEPDPSMEEEKSEKGAWFHFGRRRRRKRRRKSWHQKPKGGEKEKKVGKIQNLHFYKNAVHIQENLLVHCCDCLDVHYFCHYHMPNMNNKAYVKCTVNYEYSFEFSKIVS